MPRKLMVLGISTHNRMRIGQWRYVAAVYSVNEFAKLLDANWKYVKDYSAKTGNKEELKLAMENPHTLIPIKPQDYTARTHYITEEISNNDKL